MATATRKKRPAAKRKKTAAQIKAHRARGVKSSKKISQEGAEIGEPVIHWQLKRKGDVLREACRGSLLKFNILCFPRSSGLKPFGEVQERSIEQDEEILRYGGKVCKAEPRGYGKTTRGGNAALFGAFYNLRKMIPVFTAAMDKSRAHIDRWKTELASNEILFSMFPRTIWAFRHLGNKPQAAASQTYRGKLTHIEWSAKKIVFPTIEGEECSGNVLMALPLKSCRGAIHTMPNGTILRPDLLIFDDVQKDEDAENPNTIKKIIDLIDHSAMMLGSHSQTISAIMNTTVRKPDDTGEHYLSKSGWRHVRYKMLVQPAKWEKEFWLGEYAEIRRRYDPENPKDQRRAQKEALEFYKTNRDEADKGAVVSWEWGYAWDDNDPTEISAIQHAYNILIDLGEDVFASECQNEPIKETGGLTILSEKEIMRKQSGYVRNAFPPEVEKITCGVDVHPEILYWQIWAFEQGYTSYMIDDGTFPQQKSRNFNHNILGMTLSRMFPGFDQSAIIYAALQALLEGSEQLNTIGLMRREFIRSDGVPMRINRTGIDSSGEPADTIRRFIRQSDFSSSLTPTFGRGIGAKTLPMALWNQSKNNREDHWVPTKAKSGTITGITIDTNHWKTNFHRALALPYESKGSASLYKVESPEHFRRFASACHSERPVEVTAEGRTVYEFGEPRPGTFNHDFDTAVIARVMANKEGIRSVLAKRKKVRKTLQQLADEANSKRR